MGKQVPEMEPGLVMLTELVMEPEAERDPVMEPVPVANNRNK